LTTNSIREITIRILKEKQKPMTIKEISEYVLKERTLRSNTPLATISAVLQRSSEFVRVGKGTYYLKNQN
jgi:predicted Zn-ribbon and HTH transcriptional regulator